MTAIVGTATVGTATVVGAALQIISTQLTVTAGGTPLITVVRALGSQLTVARANQFLGTVATPWTPLGIDNDGVFYWMAGANVGIDVDGNGYYSGTPVTPSAKIAADTDGVPYLVAA